MHSGDEMFILKPCTTTAGIVVMPKKQLRLKLMQIELPFETLARTPHLIVLKANGFDVSLYPSGRMLFHTREDEDKVREVAGKLLEVLLSRQ